MEHAAPKVLGRSGVLAVSRSEMPQPASQRTSQARDLLTAEEVASLLRVTPAWVYAATRRHRIPHIRLVAMSAIAATRLLPGWISLNGDRAGVPADRMRIKEHDAKARLRNGTPLREVGGLLRPLADA
jgi:hypothetical protein